MSKKLWLILGTAFTLCVGLVAAGSITFLLMFMALAPRSDADTGASTCTIGSATTGPWTNPLAGPITSPFGQRSLELGAEHHDGTDIDGGDEGAPFYSASAGKVTAAFGTGGPEGDGDGGHGIIIDAGGGIKIWYWHAQAGSTVVKAGDTVRPGQMLARMGNTGRSFGAHLHFQVNVNGVAVDAVPFMKARGVTLGQGAPTAEVQPAGQQRGGTQSEQSGGAYSGTRSDGQKVSLQSTQVKNINGVIAEGQRLKLPEKAIVISVVTVLQESSGWMYASSGNPSSLSMPHDKVGSDHDSVGLFQQRPAAGWGRTEDLMNVERSARKFWGKDTAGPRGLLDVPGWEQMSVADAAQSVQVSAFPDAYGRWEPVARELISLAGGSPLVNCTGNNDFGAGAPLPAGTSSAETRAKIIDAAKSGLGHPYVWGGTTPQGWDCSGYVQWAMTKAGINGVPRTEQWAFGRKTANPQPGDLVVQIPDGNNHWTHVGIYAGNGQMYSALNPDQGTLLHPVDWNPGSEYFTMTD